MVSPFVSAVCNATPAAAPAARRTATSSDCLSATIDASLSYPGRTFMQISAQQLAELLTGIARAQAAIIQGMENELAGIRSGRIIPALQNVAHLRDHPNPTLTDLPSRVLLGTLGRAVPDMSGLVRDLERLFGEPAAQGAAMDFTKPA